MIAAVSPLNDSGMLIWTIRLTLLVSGAGGLLGVGAMIAGVLGNGPAAGIMGIGAAVALLVAISGRWTTIRSERWAGADTPPTTARVSRNRVVIRRRDTA
ncbi:MAG: hypothetical protein HOV83_19780, partial [Catenulispora sp.]|nr:hypothetical protein [Catenulispora sp.]